MAETERSGTKVRLMKKTEKLALDVVLHSVMIWHVVYCPYTKVEESFNLQAIHDLLYHGNDIEKYDHLEFPGVVPRTFLGPLVIAVFSYPFLYMPVFLGLSKFLMQYIARLVLGSLVLLAFHKFKESVEKQFGYSVSMWLQLMTATQFHFMFYLSRPLPNTFALILALFAFHFWLGQNPRMFILTSAAAVIVFRAELSILLGLIALQEIILEKISILQILCWGVPAGLWMLGLTVAVDSYFWMRPVWPEGEVLWFNIFLNKSSEWGTSPWGWYFYSALPRAMLLSIFFIPFALKLDYRMRVLVYPALGFIFLYSFLPHKELRFIIYTVPLLNVAAARTCVHLWNNRLKSLFHSLLTHLACLHLVFNICATVFILSISHYNYPGGIAMDKFHKIEMGEKSLNIHVDVFCAQTGVSRFTELNSNWRYNKSETLTLESLEILQFTHLLMEWNDNVNDGGGTLLLQTYSVSNITHGFSHWSIDVSSYPPIKIYLKPKVLLLKRIMPYPSVILNSTRMLSHKF